MSEHKSVPENPPAFPPAITVSAAGDVYHGFNGMGLRDWFAGQALPAIIAATSAGQHSPDVGEGGVVRAMADDAYSLADAMLAAREASK